MPLELLKLATVGSWMAALTALAYFAWRQQSSFVHQIVLRHVQDVDAQLRLLFSPLSARRVIIGQALLLFATACAFIWVPSLWSFAAFLAALAAPSVILTILKRHRVRAIENQLGAFATTLANTLKSNPSIHAAFLSIEPLLTRPLSQEINLVAKEMRLGTPLETCLTSMAQRVRSLSLRSVLSSILIARRVGGNLPEVLSTTAAALREMTRLERVVRAKTAQSKAQLVVLSLAPAVVVFAFDAVRPGYFDPLFASFSGIVVLALASGSWLASIVVARQVLAVDI
jgi:tight adherence protein B